MTYLEPAVRALGLLLVAAAAFAFDPRLGLAAGGVFLILSTIDLRGARR
jgi:hypothetical protein